MKYVQYNRCLPPDFGSGEWALRETLAFVGNHNHGYAKINAQIIFEKFCLFLVFLHQAIRVKIKQF